MLLIGLEGEKKLEKMGMGLRKWVGKSEAVLSMLMVQVFATGLQLLSRIILSEGTFIFALMTYRHIVAAICVAPFAFILERGKSKKLGWLGFFWLFINALTGILMAMGLFYYGIRDTSATYATNFLNLIPIVTFALSIITQMEKLGLGSKPGKVKVGGAILCVAGALIIILYKGRAFHIGHGLVLRSKHVTAAQKKADWTRGTLLLVGSCLSYAAWFIVQVKLLKVFPLKYWATMLTCIIAATQSAVLGVCLDRSKLAWKLRWNLQLVTIVYSGALATAATFILISRTVAKQGPTFPAMFNPLALMFVAILEALLLGEQITVGSLVGMALIIMGLYSFLWGRRSETKGALPAPNIAAGEVGTAVPPESVTATVMPTASPISDIAIKINDKLETTAASDQEQNQIMPTTRSIGI